MEEIQHIHQGRNIKRFREMLGMKQENLAVQLGDDWTQKKVSQLESKEKIEEDILEQVAKILKVSPEAIQKFNEQAAINIISSTFQDNASGVNYQCDINFNPLDKLIESYEENKKLYVQLIQAEKDKVAFLENILKSK